MKERVRISVDLDGVIANFLDAFRKVANEVFPGRITDDWQPYNYAYSDKFAEEEFKKVFDAIHTKKNFWVGLKPDQKNISELRDFLCRNSDIDVYYITARAETVGKSILAQSTDWLFRYQVWPVKFRASVIAVKTGVGKADVIRQLGVHYSIDDHPETVIESNKVEGHKAFLLDRSWNREAEYKDVPRVKNLLEFLEMIRPKPKPHEKKHVEGSGIGYKFTKSSLYGLKTQLLGKNAKPKDGPFYTAPSWFYPTQKVKNGENWEEFPKPNFVDINTPENWGNNAGYTQLPPPINAPGFGPSNPCSDKTCPVCQYSQPYPVGGYIVKHGDKPKPKKNCDIPNCKYCASERREKKKSGYKTYVFNVNRIPVVQLTEGTPAGSITSITKVRSNEDV